MAPKVSDTACLRRIVTTCYTAGNVLAVMQDPACRVCDWSCLVSRYVPCLGWMTGLQCQDPHLGHQVVCGGGIRRQAAKGVLGQLHQLVVVHCARRRDHLATQITQRYAYRSSDQATAMFTACCRAAGLDSKHSLPQIHAGPAAKGSSPPCGVRCSWRRCSRPGRRG